MSPAKSLMNCDRYMQVLYRTDDLLLLRVCLPVSSPGGAGPQGSGLGQRAGGAGRGSAGSGDRPARLPGYRAALGRPAAEELCRRTGPHREPPGDVLHDPRGAGGEQVQRSCQERV